MCVCVCVCVQRGCTSVCESVCLYVHACVCVCVCVINFYSLCCPLAVQVVTRDVDME